MGVTVIAHSLSLSVLWREGESERERNRMSHSNS